MFTKVILIAAAALALMTAFAAWFILDAHADGQFGNEWFLGAIGAAMGLVFFGLLGPLVWFFVSAALRPVPTVPLLEGESVLHEIPANRLTDWVAHGGWLRFTDRRLLFVPHRFNDNCEPVVIEWSRVQRATVARSAGIEALKLLSRMILSHVPLAGKLVPDSKVLTVSGDGFESRFVVVATTDLELLLRTANVSSDIEAGD